MLNLRKVSYELTLLYKFMNFLKFTEAICSLLAFSLSAIICLKFFFGKFLKKSVSLCIDISSNISTEL